MRKLLLLFLLCVLPLAAIAYDAEIDGFYYNLNKADKTATMTYLYFANNESFGNIHLYSGEINIPSQVTYEGVTYTVKTIGHDAFYGYCDITSVKIPNTVTSIEGYAFSGCTSLSSVEIPNSVTSIGRSAFYKCSSLASISIPSSVMSIGYDAFNNTAWESTQPLGPVYLDNCLVGKRGTINTKVEVKDGTRVIADGAFYECGIASLIIPNSVKHIGETCCEACPNLGTVTIGDGVITLGKSAFYNCQNLTNLKIGNSVTTIGDYAFISCKSLTTLTLPNSVTSIGEWAFRDCIQLATISFSDNLSSVGAAAFDGTPWYSNQPDGIIYLGKVAYCYKGTMPNNASINIKDGTLRISSSAFREQSNLASVTLPSSLKGIGGSAFSQCTGLTSITIPDNVVNIDDYAFSRCTGLKTVTIGSSVTSIGREAFILCNDIESVTVKAETPPTAPEDAFSNYTIELIVPESGADAYSTTVPWSKFTTIKTIGGAEVQKKKCAKPTVTFLENDNLLRFGCETEGVAYHFEISSNQFTAGSTGGSFLPFTKKNRRESMGHEGRLGRF